MSTCRNRFIRLGLVGAALLASVQVWAKPQRPTPERGETSILDEAALEKLEYIVRHRVGPESTRAAYMVKLAYAYSSKSKRLQLESIETQDSTKERESVELWKKAIERLEWVRTNAADKVHLDRVLFDLGFTFLELGDIARAEKELTEVYRRFPKSGLRSDTALILGDLAFDQKNLAAAFRYYDDAEISATQNRTAHYSRYRKGWVRFHQGNVNEAIALMESCAFPSDAAQGVEFRQEAISDLILFYARKGGLQAGFENLSNRIPEKERSDLLVRFIDRAATDGLFVDVVELSLQYEKRFAPDANVSNVYGKWLAARLSLNQEFEADLKKWSDHIRDGSDFRKLLQKSPEVLSSATKGFEEFLKTSAIRYHAMAKKEKREKDWIKAGVFYATYENHFSDPQVLLSYGHFFLERKQENAALVRYDRVLDSLTGNEHNDTILKVLALRQDRVIVSGSPESERKLFETRAREFQTKYPDHLQQASISLALINMYLNNGNQIQAESELKRWLPLRAPPQNPHFEEKAQAQMWAMLLDLYASQERFTEIRAMGQLALASTAVQKDQSLTKKLGTLLSVARFRIAQSLMDGPNSAAAESAFLEFAQEESDPEQVQKAYWNASLAALKLGNYSSAIQHLGRVGITPDRTLHDKAQRQLLKAALDVGDLETARQVSILIENKCAQAFCEDDAFMATQLNLYSGYEKEASKLFEKAVRNKISGLRWLELGRQLGQREWVVVQLKRETSMEDRFLLKLVRQGWTLPSALFEGRGSQPSGKAFRALQNWNRLKALNASVSATVIKGTENQQALAMKKALEDFEKIRLGTEEMLGFGDPIVALEALKVAVGASQALAKAIRSSPVPSRLTDEQIAIYQEALEAKAKESEAQAQSYLALGRALVKKTALLGETAQFFIADLARVPVLSELQVATPTAEDQRQLLLDSNRVDLKLKILQSLYARNQDGAARSLVQYWSMDVSRVLPFEYQLALNRGEYGTAAAMVVQNRDSLIADPRLVPHLQGLDLILQQSEPSLSQAVEPVKEVNP